MDVEKFISSYLDCIETEKEADAAISALKEQQALANPKCVSGKNVHLPKVNIIESQEHIYGHKILKFGLKNAQSLPISKLAIGDPVAIWMHPLFESMMEAKGVVSEKTDNCISVVIKKQRKPLEEDSTYFICKLKYESLFKIMKETMVKVGRIYRNRESHMVQVAFGYQEPHCLSELPDIKLYNENLNEDQVDAVKFALAQKEIAIIHGPPGTGKTTVLIEVILQLISQGLKLLVCASSNIAVDNLAERLLEVKAKIVRLGHPARFLPSVDEVSLDAFLCETHVSQPLQDLEKLITDLERIPGKGPHSSELDKLRKDRRKLLVKAQREILLSKDVVLCTLSTASIEGPLHVLDDKHFDVVLVDEGSQCLEAACWIPLLLAPKCVLAGDHLQLPPVIKAKELSNILGVTLLERLVNFYDDKIMRMLTIQYRMNTQIMKWVSAELYKNKLKAHSSVAGHLLSDLPGVLDTENTSIPLLMIDTVGTQCEEVADADDSKGNFGEADLVAMYVKLLINDGVRQQDIGVITPYSLQVGFIRQRLSNNYKAVEVRSVDGFQGREKEVIVLSFVRSNPHGTVGFLTEDRRINVAITRARRHLCIIGNSETLSHHAFLREFLSYMTSNGEVRSAAQYESEIGCYPAWVDSSSATPGTEEKQKKKRTKKSKKEKEAAEKFTDNTFNYKVKDILPFQDSSISKEEETIRETLKVEIEAFLNSDDIEWIFPTTLTSYERFVIHELADSMGLNHISSGEKENGGRFIKIWKPLKFFPENLKDSNIENVTVCKFGSIEEEMSQISDISNVNYPKGEVVLENKGSVSQGAVRKKTKEPKQVVNKKSHKSKLKTLPSSNDDDELLDAAINENKVCALVACKKPVMSYLGFTICSFCKRNFCLSHAMPEIHGCGDDVRSAVKSKAKLEGKVHPSSGKPYKILNPVQRQELLKYAKTWKVKKK